MERGERGVRMTNEVQELAGSIKQNRFKTTQKIMKEYMAEFRACIEKFGLQEWDVKYFIAPLDGNLATLEYDYNVCNARTTVNSTLPCGTDIKELAKHEAIHLMLAPMDFVATVRCVQPEEITRANEALTIKLSKLIK